MNANRLRRDSSADATDGTLVFVYGSLRRNECNHGLLGASDLVAAGCRVRGQLYDTGYGYPALVLTDTAWTTGELYNVTNNVLHRLDELEGYNGEGFDNDYNREQMPVWIDDRTVLAYGYTYTPDRVIGMQKVVTGDWSGHPHSDSC